MKTLSLMMILLFGIVFIPVANAQYCGRDYEYYHNDDGYYKYHKKYWDNYKYRQYRKNYYYRNNMSIISFERRIEDGVKSGELTRYEKKKLVRKLNALINYRDYILSDGYISRYERRKFEKKKLKLDRMIFDKKHNHRRRY